MYMNSFLNFPSELLDRIAGSSITSELAGKSGAKVYRVKKPDRSICYLKTQQVKDSFELVNEVNVYDWLDDRLRVPRVIYYDILNEMEFMLYSAVEGNHANSGSFFRNIDSLVKIIAKGLKQLHSIDIKACELDKRLEIKLKKAKRRIDKNLVEEWDFQPENKNKKPIDIYNELINSKPDTEDLVFTHGDFCLSNIIINSENQVGFIDMGNGGIADRYQDIALIIRDLKNNINIENSNKYIELFLKEYGIQPNIEKIKYYILLDELF